MMELEDTTLVTRSLEGDPHAFEAIVDRYQKVVFNIAFRLTQDRSEAEDVAQTTFLKAFEGLRSYNSRHKFFSWLYAIALHEALNASGRKGRFARLEEEVESAGDTPEEVVTRKQIEERVVEGLAKLKFEHRVVIVLKHLENLSYEEISQILGIPEKKVKSRLFTARTMLRDVLAQKGIGPNG
jgi:RNA polymerase sigma-70 factor (ECF subfamily)